MSRAGQVGATWGGGEQEWRRVPVVEITFREGCRGMTREYLHVAPMGVVGGEGEGEGKGVCS